MVVELRPLLRFRVRSIPESRGSTRETQILAHEVEELRRVSTDGEMRSCSIREIADWVVLARPDRQLLLADIVPVSAASRRSSPGGHRVIASYLR